MLSLLGTQVLSGALSDKSHSTENVCMQHELNQCPVSWGWLCKHASLSWNLLCDGS